MESRCNSLKNRIVRIFYWIIEDEVVSVQKSKLYVYNGVEHNLTVSVHWYEHPVLWISAIITRVFGTHCQMRSFLKPITKLYTHYRLLVNVFNQFEIVFQLSKIYKGNLAPFKSYHSVFWPNWMNINRSNRIFNKVFSILFVSTDQRLGILIVDIK